MFFGSKGRSKQKPLKQWYYLFANHILAVPVEFLLIIKSFIFSKHNGFFGRILKSLWLFAYEEKAANYERLTKLIGYAEKK